MCARLCGRAANCSISPHLGTFVLVKVLLHLWDSSVLGILPEPITQRPSITPRRLAVIIISITPPQLAWFTSLNVAPAPAPHPGGNMRLLAITRPVSPCWGGRGAGEAFHIFNLFTWLKPFKFFFYDFVSFLLDAFLLQAKMCVNSWIWDLMQSVNRSISGV